MSRMRPTAAALASSILSGESFGETISRHPKIFPPIYVALIRIGETSGALVTVLEALAAERQRAEALSRRISDALRYPAFLLFAAGAVLLFFLNFVLPQFANIFRDFDAKLDPVLTTFLRFSDFMRSNGQTIAAVSLVSLLAGWFILRRRSTRGPLIRALVRLPIVRPIMDYHRTGRFCRNLGLMLSSGVMLTSALRILVDTMEATGTPEQWSTIVDKVRHGGKLSDALMATRALPPMAIQNATSGRKLWSAGDACRTCCRFLRGETPAKSRSRYWNCRTARHHRHQSDRRRADRVGDDGAALCLSGRRLGD